MSILHNGAPTGKTDKTAFPALTVDSIFASAYEFDKWSYTVNGGTSIQVTSNDDLFNAILAAADGSVIDVTAVLKPKNP